MTSFFDRQAFEFAAVFDFDIQVVLVNTPVTQVDVGGIRSYAGGLHQDGCLPHLFIQFVPVIGIAGKCSGTHDEGSFERGSMKTSL